MKNLIITGLMLGTFSTLASAKITSCENITLEVQMFDADNEKIVGNTHTFASEKLRGKDLTRNRGVSFKGTRGDQYIWGYDKVEGLTANKSDIVQLLHRRYSELSKAEKQGLDRLQSNTSYNEKVPFDPTRFWAGKYTGKVETRLGGYDDTKYDAIKINFTYYNCSK